MTVLELNKARDYVEVELTGHAGKAHNGDDVCAACSILTNTLIHTLPKEALKLYDEKDAMVRIHVPINTVSLIRLRFFLSGMGLLAEYYPECVKTRGELKF